MRILALTALLLMASTARAEDRVATARKARLQAVTDAFARAGVAFPPEELYVRGFKHERELEVWAGARGGKLVKVKTYPFCAASGDLGPKRVQGDLQVPEGFYAIDLFNPYSNYHLSMRVNYPNAVDRHARQKGEDLGGNIFVHGNCVSIGCIAIRDEPIEELYLMVLDTRARTKRNVPIHLFPRRLDDAGMAALEQYPAITQDLLAFWRSLRPAYELFEESHRLPQVSIDAKRGAYVVKPALASR